LAQTARASPPNKLGQINLQRIAFDDFEPAG